MEKYFETRSELYEYLVSELKFTEEDADEYELEDYEEEQYKRTTRCSGYILDTGTGNYYFLVFDNDYDYDWGNSNFCLCTTPLEMKEEVQTITVKKFVPIKEETIND